MQFVNFVDPDSNRSSCSLHLFMWCRAPETFHTGMSWPTCLPCVRVWSARSSPAGYCNLSWPVSSSQLDEGVEGDERPEGKKDY